MLLRVGSFEIIITTHKAMKMQLLLFRVSLVLLLGNSSIFLLSPGKVSANSNISDNLSDVNHQIETGCTGKNCPPNNKDGTLTEGTPTKGTPTEGTPTEGTPTRQPNTTNNGDVNDELLPETNSEETEETETETAETAETPETAATPQAITQPTPQPTPINTPGDTVSAPQVEFAPIGETSSPIQAAAESAIAQLGAGTFGGDGAGGISIPASTQQTIIILLTGDPTTKSLFGDPLQNPLIRTLEQGGAGQLSAWKLAESLLGLLRGGRVNSKKLLAAVAAYNALIKASNDEFLLNPPPELVAIRAVLAELVSAAEAEYRTPD